MALNTKYVKCPECGSKHTIKAGFTMTRKGRKQRRQCKDCGHIFYAKQSGFYKKQTKGKGK